MTGERKKVTFLSELFFVGCVLSLIIDSGYCGESESAQLPVNYTVESLTKQLAGKDWSERIRAARALRDMEGKAVTAIPALMETLRDDRWAPMDGYTSIPFVTPAMAAAEALKAIIPFSDGSSFSLARQFIQDTNKDTRSYAARLLGYYGDKAIPVLLEVIQNQNEDHAVRINAAFAFQSIATNGDSGLEELKALMRDKNAKRYEGGYTDVFVRGVIRDVHHCDIRSLYPSLMLSRRICRGRVSRILR